MTADMSKVVPLADAIREATDEASELKALAQRAREYVTSFQWCAGVREMYSGIAVPGVIGVFLMRIKPRGTGVDDELWVVVGDIPPAYLVTDEASTPAKALMLYANLMQDWVDAVNEDRPVADLIPVNAEPTKNMAAMLDSRLRFLVERVVPTFSDRT